MKYNNMKYKILTFLLVLVTLVSCEDELLVNDANGIPKEISDGYSIALTLTLDKMGGDNGATRAPGSPNTPKEMEDIENYINPEKLRILFFDSEERFLFESKSRWVKKLEQSSSDHSSWIVSVPVFAYGNDEKCNWNWEQIRKAMTTESFKIVVLANRPEKEVLPELEDNVFGGKKDFDNSGPHWTVDDTRWQSDWTEVLDDNGNVIYNKNVKYLFDLHHCQHDPIYENKSRPSENKGAKVWNGEDFYGFIMGGVNGKDRTMSATSSWVNWGDDLQDSYEGNHIYGENIRRCWRRPSQDYPIPMYGVQNFDKIENWVQGTPFNLSDIVNHGNDADHGNDEYNYKVKDISLLRSVVRLELLIPKTIGPAPDNVLLFYTNIYARCEPMDIWTPTEELWKEDHKTSKECDWYSIRKYGTITKSTDPKGKINKTEDNNGGQKSFEQFRERISWFYGAWLDPQPGTSKDDGTYKPRWDFGTGKFYWGEITEGSGPSQSYPQEPSIPYPRIFNPCTQRNQKVFCDDVDYSDYYNDGYYHYVVYTGERNLNDPNKLYNLGGSVGMDGTVSYWWFNIGDKAYTLPLADYDSGFSGLEKVLTSFNYNNDEPDNTTGISEYAQAVQQAINPEDLPWPLVRNHVYRITVGYVPGAKPIVESRTWKFEPNSETITNLKNDPQWTYSNANLVPTYLSFNADAGYNKDIINKATWGNYTIEIKSNDGKDKKFEIGNEIQIEGKKYKAIRLSNMATNTLTLPAGKVCTKMTLYSYINTTKAYSEDPKFRTCYWQEVAGVEYSKTEENILKCFSDGDLSNPDKREYSFAEEPKNIITFKNTGEQLCFVAVLDVEDELPYWQLKNPSGMLTANGETIEELEDLKFANASAINIYEKERHKIRLTGAATITFPKMLNGTKISITGQSANHDASNRGIQPVQSYLEPGEGTNPGVNYFLGSRVDGATNGGVYTFNWEVNTTEDRPVDVQFKLVEGGIDFYEFNVEVPSTRSASTNESQPPLVVRSENLYSRSIKF